MARANMTLIEGTIVEEEVLLTLVELCQACNAKVEHVQEWVFEGVLEPIGESPHEWRFKGDSCVVRNWRGGFLTTWTSTRQGLRLHLICLTKSLRCERVFNVSGSSEWRHKSTSRHSQSVERTFTCRPFSETILRGHTMLITFKSPASADVMMFGEVAEKMLEIIGKEPSGKGIITVENLPAAIARMKDAINADVQSRGQATQDANGADSVSIAQRALPLVELFERSLKQEVPVVWGV